MRSLRRVSSGLILALVLGSCHCHTEPRVPASFAKFAGDKQSATVASSLSTLPSIVIRDADGEGIPGISVTFTAGFGAGTLTGVKATTNGDGVATLGGWTLSPAAGSNTVIATATGITVPGSPTVFTATGTAGVPTTIAKLGFDPISPPAGTSIDSIAVKVTDQFGNGVPGAEVNFAATAGGGAVSPATVVTDVVGQAATRWTVGTAAFVVNAVTVMLPSVANASVIFTATTTVTGVRFAATTVVVDSGATITPVVGGMDAAGNVVAGGSIDLQTRSNGVATASGTTVTGVRPGQTILVATSLENPAVRDSAVLVVAGANAPVVTAVVPRFDLKPDTTLTIPFIVDMRSSGLALGSATLQITWDPTVLTYVSDVDGAASAGAAVNSTTAAAGSLTLGIANATGLAGAIEIRKVTFKATSVAGRTGLPLRIFVLDMAAATTLVDLQRRTVTATYPLRTR